MFLVLLLVLCDAKSADPVFGSVRWVARLPVRPRVL